MPGVKYYIIVWISTPTFLITLKARHNYAMRIQRTEHRRWEKETERKELLNELHFDFGISTEFFSLTNWIFQYISIKFKCIRVEYGEKQNYSINLTKLLLILIEWTKKSSTHSKSQRHQWHWKLIYFVVVECRFGSYMSHFEPH